MQFFICANIRTFFRTLRFTPVNNRFNMTINTIRSLVTLKHLLPPTHTRSWKNNYVVKLLHTSNLIFAQKITKKVKSYGTLSIELPCNVQVKSIDPHQFPDMDTLLVNICSDNSQNVDVEQFLKIHTDQSVSTINAQNYDNFNFPTDATFVFQTPIQYGKFMNTFLSAFSTLYLFWHHCFVSESFIFQPLFTLTSKFVFCIILDKTQFE